MFGVNTPPLNASVRLPIRVPRLEVSARMSSAMERSLRFRGTPVAAVRATRSGVQTVTVLVSSRPGAGCVSRQRQVNHQVPRSRASSGRRRRSQPSPLVSSSSSVRVGGVCRCIRGQPERAMHIHRYASFDAGRLSQAWLYLRAKSAYGWGTMRQPNYAFERTVKSPRKHLRHRAAAQRER